MEKYSQTAEGRLNMSIARDMLRDISKRMCTSDSLRDAALALVRLDEPKMPENVVQQSGNALFDLYLEGNPTPIIDMHERVRSRLLRSAAD